MVEERTIGRQLARIALGATVALATILSGACGSEESAPEPMPLPPGDALPEQLSTVLFGSADACRGDDDCGGAICYFGSCVGILIVDQRWMQETMADRLAEAVADRPELAERAVARLRAVLEKADTDTAYKARALIPLEALLAVDAIASTFETASGALKSAAALALLRLHDPRGFKLVVALTEHRQPALAAEALRALGSSGMPEALVPLLRTLNPEMERTLLYAALAGLGELKDPRAIRPLVDFLADAPGYLRRPTAEALAAITGTRPSLDVEAWRARVTREAPPDAPPYELRAYSAPGDLGIPTP